MTVKASGTVTTQKTLAEQREEEPTEIKVARALQRLGSAYGHHQFKCREPVKPAAEAVGLFVDGFVPADAPYLGNGYYVGHTAVMLVPDVACSLYAGLRAPFGK